jgi:DNA replication protein DnaC
MPHRPKANPATVNSLPSSPPTASLPETSLPTKSARSEDLRERILADFATLKVPLRAEAFDAILAEVEREGVSHLSFLHRLIAEQASQRRERSVAYRVKEARFKEPKTLATFDWLFNAKTIDRSRIEELATGEFIRRRENLVFLGQSGVGKSHLVQGIGHRACVLGWRVRYTTSAELLEDLRASLADQTLPSRLREYASFDLLIIDEFGFDRLERLESPQAASLLYKVIDARNQQRSTALISNIDFAAWGEYLGDAPLAMALTDRIVYRAIMLKITGRSYRAQPMKPKASD